MGKKKTAVEQMIEFIRSNEYTYLYVSVVDEWFKTFLEKEKQQIIDAYDSGEFMAEVKERYDYDETDCKYNNGEEYYKHIKSG